MLNKEKQQNEQRAALLQEKPLRRQKLRPAPFLLLGGIVILGALLVVGWQVYTTDNASSSTGQGSRQSKGPAHAPWDEYPEVYWQTLRRQVAQGLHLTEQQIQDNLHSTLLANDSTGSNRSDITSADAAKWMSDLARAHGVSLEQLHSIEVAAVQQAHAVLVNQHVLTQQQASENIKSMNQDDLNLHMVDAFAKGDNTHVQGK